MPAKAPVYIVDDDDAVRDSLGFQLTTAGLEVRTFKSGEEFLREAPSLLPGCVILDVRMPDLDGPAVQLRLSEQQLNFPVIMITGHGDVPLAVRAMKAGAVDFVEKPFLEETMLDSIRLAHERLLSIRSQDQDKSRAIEQLSSLSAREREVLERLVVGLPNKTIAYELAISQRTVEVHRAHIMSKTQARGFSDLVRLALLAGVSMKH